MRPNVRRRQCKLSSQCTDTVLAAAGVYSRGVEVKEGRFEKKTSNVKNLARASLFPAPPSDVLSSEPAKHL